MSELPHPLKGCGFAAKDFVPNNPNAAGKIENTGDTSGLEWYLILFCLSLLLGIIVTVAKVKKSNRKM